MNVYIGGNQARWTNDNVADHDTLILWGFIKNQPKVFMTGSTKYFYRLISNLWIFEVILIFITIFLNDKVLFYSKNLITDMSCQQYD